ncbi:MAG TPA: RbsD/FucU domain-containing protein [Sedimentisphaerales bacterium]|nr:RbsD/FucU domain-containing protein [Sedimentisphaerales bacterium]
MGKALGRRIKIAGLATLLATSMLTAGCATETGCGWRKTLAAELPVLGHRNWIVIADSAYPAQSRAGIETAATGADQIEVVKAALKAVDGAKHVRANVYLDAEMKYVAEESAPGIEAYRRELAVLLDKRAVKSVPHEELIARLDEAAKTFRILILKTNLTLPYTSVFLELDCGYWSPQAEQELRQTIHKADKRP